MLATVEWLQILAAVGTFAGTWLQARASLIRLREVDAESVRTYHDIVEMKTEYQPFLHPLKYWQNQRVVRQLLAKGSLDGERYRRVRSQLFSWAILWAAAFGALAAALIDVVA